MFPSTPSTPAKTTWTLLIYLTGPETGCVGGETIFYPELGSAKQYSGRSAEGTQPISVGLEVGMALLHKHGQDCLLHEGAEVKEGEKWVIRSDLCGRYSLGLWAQPRATFHIWKASRVKTADTEAFNSQTIDRYTRLRQGITLSQLRPTITHPGQNWVQTEVETTCQIKFTRLWHSWIKLIWTEF